MIYFGKLGTNQQLYIENRGSQTLITLVSSSSGQQQSQSSSWKTGSWTAPPSLFQNEGIFLLRIDSDEGQHFIQVQASGFNSLATAPSLIKADVIPLQKVSETATSGQSSVQSQPMEPMEPMEPMKPMKLGDMSMGVNPMEMRMGNMYMRMPENSKLESPSKSNQNFCTQCGTVVKAGDRFCANCGHKLEN
jgi:hypothetical protein